MATRGGGVQNWAELELGTRSLFRLPMHRQGPRDLGGPLLLCQAIRRELDSKREQQG